MLFLSGECRPSRLGGSLAGLLLDGFKPARSAKGKEVANRPITQIHTPIRGFIDLTIKTPTTVRDTKIPAMWLMSADTPKKHIANIKMDRGRTLTRKDNNITKDNYISRNDYELETPTHNGRASKAGHSQKKSGSPNDKISSMGSSQVFEPSVNRRSSKAGHGQGYPTSPSDKIASMGSHQDYGSSFHRRSSKAGRSHRPTKYSYFKAELRSCASNVTLGRVHRLGAPLLALMVELDARLSPDDDSRSSCLRRPRPGGFFEAKLREAPGVRQFGVGDSGSAFR